MRKLAAAAATALLLVAACGGDDDDDPAAEADPTTTAAPDATGDAGEDGDAATTTTTEPAEPLVVLVSNDDGYAAGGIAALVDALAARPDVEVVVVAPDGNRSGSGGQTTPEGITATEVTMANGHPATAVSGFPADAVIHALDVMGVEPDLVMSGTNEGQNLGPVLDLSGTVGAARIAAQRGIPAVAVSTGLSASEPDHEAAVAVAMAWLDEHIDDLEGATADQVVNINVPTCAAGEVRGELEVPFVPVAGDRNFLAADVDCSVTGPEPADDLDGFNAGFAVISLVPATPAAPAG